ncbi:hypothetical protein GCM10010862_10040 [Devosia nitrariae]|uniref:Glycosyl transferase family 2 n=2 Tax=Devosia nitrariae TaxID=2071872 RepID=A0ABQ5W1F3_9HYPH|nr:hypothetical protein GCM10010862_10040 [Devosia nitrariae]
MLPEGVVRGMRPTTGVRPAGFADHYEGKVLFYDIFWHRDGRTVLLVGPPSIDLDQRLGKMVCVAQPSGKRLAWREHNSKRMRLCSIRPPAGTTHLEISYAGATQTVAIAENASGFFDGARVLFTLSKNNRLEWIADWARFHALNQGTDAVILVDNGSTDYSPDEIETVLACVPGIERVAVLPAPFPYGQKDEWVAEDQNWSQFLQPAMFLVVWRRYAQAACGILNCDIDELAVPSPDGNVYEAAARSRSGTVYYRGAWVAAVPEDGRSAPYRHGDFRRLEADPERGMSSLHKWAMAPNRRWLERLSVHPYPHFLRNRPMGTRHKPTDVFIAHFRGISTSWKYDRHVSKAAGTDLPVEPALAQALDRTFSGSGGRGASG